MEFNEVYRYIVCYLNFKTTWLTSLELSFDDPNSKFYLTTILSYQLKAKNKNVFKWSILQLEQAEI